MFIKKHATLIVIVAVVRRQNGTIQSLHQNMKLSPTKSTQAVFVCFNVGFSCFFFYFTVWLRKFWNLQYSRYDVFIKNLEFLFYFGIMYLKKIILIQNNELRNTFFMYVYLNVSKQIHLITVHAQYIIVIGYSGIR